MIFVGIIFVTFSLFQGLIFGTPLEVSLFQIKTYLILSSLNNISIVYDYENILPDNIVLKVSQGKTRHLEKGTLNSQIVRRIMMKVKKVRKTRNTKRGMKRRKTKVDTQLDLQEIPGHVSATKHIFTTFLSNIKDLVK